MEIATFAPDTADIAIPAIGVGTWKMGEDESTREDEVRALRHAIDLGFTHFDTAEMYADGGAEEVLGEAIAEVDRDDRFLVSKVYPWNASADDMHQACSASLSRLGVDVLDLYLLHWPGNVPFDDTLGGARRLMEEGKIKAFGVSNFDDAGLRDLEDRGLLGSIAANQVMHNIPNRQAETGLFPFMADRGITAIAYSPLEIGPMGHIPGMQNIADDAGLSLAQLAVAWHLTQGKAAPIPKSARTEHLDDIARAIEIAPLDRETMDRIDQLAPLPNPNDPLPMR